MIGFRWNPETDLWLPPEEVADSFAHYISYVLENRNAAGNRDVDQLEYCRQFCIIHIYLEKVIPN